MNISRAKQIGRKKALISITLGLIISYLIIALLWTTEGFVKSLLWISEFGYTLNILSGIAFLYTLGFFFGQMSGVEILIRKRNPFFTGIKYAFLTLIISATLASSIGFFQEGIHHFSEHETPIVDYIIKPLFWIGIFGFIPVILTGVFFGYSIKKRRLIL
ncbi:MAG: hypothetical protein ACJ75J_13765 [Cytophagaceae bacterium]